MLSSLTQNGLLLKSYDCEMANKIRRTTSLHV